jgi:hypothetical protein
MPESDEALRLLREIRDAHQALLAEYRSMAARSTALQEQAVQRQEQLGRLYRRVVAVGAVAGGVLLVLVGYLLVRILRFLP